MIKLEEIIMTSQASLRTVASQSTMQDLRSIAAHSLRSRTSQNPIIQRAKQRLCEDASPGQVITSYDRMYHRHNRT